MGNDTEPKEIYDAPVGKSERKKRDKVKKERIHIYITSDSIERIDVYAEELGLDRSPCIQMLLNTSLKDLESSKDIQNNGKLK